MLKQNEYDELYIQGKIGALIVFGIILKYLCKHPGSGFPTQYQLPKELIVRWQNSSTIFQIFSITNNIKPKNQYLCYDFISAEDRNIASRKKK